VGKRGRGESFGRDLSKGGKGGAEGEVQGTREKDGRYGGSCSFGC